MKITLGMSTMDIVAALCEGNPGALDVCVRLFKDAPAICPSWGTGGFHPLLALDAEGVYGPSIWVLYKDICGSSISRTWALLCAAQVGLWSGEHLKHLAADVYRSDDWAATTAEAVKQATDAVPEKIPDFNLSIEENGA